jgi:hypothetical protein
VAAALTVVGAGIAVAGGTPAQAAVINNANPVPAGTTSAAAVATCPAGQILTGSGGSVTGGGGDVTLTDVIPDIAAGTVTAWGHVNAGGVSPAFTVTAQAICAPIAAPAGYTIVVRPGPINATPIKTQPAACPNGLRLLGTGAELVGGNGEVYYQSIAPDPALTSSVVTAGAAGGYAGTWGIVAYAICGLPPAGVVPQLYDLTGPVNSVSPKAQASPVCPAGMFTTGVGGTLSPSTTGSVLLAALGADLAQDMATAGGVEDGVYLPSWAVQASNICW